MNHVAGIVGGFNSQEKVVGQEGRIFNLIPKEYQQEAVKFLLENAFTTPTWMIDEEILRRIEPVGAIDRIHTAQSRVLTTLLNSARFARLLEQETLDGNLAYSPVEFLATVRKGLWKRTGRAAGEDRCLPARAAALLSAGRERETESRSRGGCDSGVPIAGGRRARCGAATHERR